MNDRWDAERVLALRRHLGLSQHRLARELGTRQQTISEWERGAYAPRGISSKLLGILAERAEFQYDPGTDGRAENGGEGERG